MLSSSSIIIITLFTKILALNDTQNWSISQFRSQKDAPHFTGYNGAEISNIDSSLSAGAYGPIAFWDQILMEKLGHLVRERIPERIVAARGNSAFGYFECTNDGLPELTKADFLSSKNKKTKVVVRFSVGVGSVGVPEPTRTVFGFAIKFYTDEGNYDLLTASLPVLTIRDPIRLPDLGHALDLRPDDHLMDVNREFDYVANNPEVLHRILFLSSDAGIPDGFRRITGWSISTFKFVNKKNEYNYVRFIVEPLQKKKWLSDDEAAFLRGNEPDYFSRDLIGAIEAGFHPNWLIKAQILTPEKAKELPFNPFDTTKLWDKKLIPAVTLGKLVLDKTIDNWFSQSELLAFNPQNLVPGIEPSLEKILQGRLFAYRDAQNYRLGANYFKLGINRPKVPLEQPEIRDGFCADYENGGNDPNYYPNSFGKIRDSKKQTMLPFLIAREELKRYNSLDDDNYSQVNQSWINFDHEERSRIAIRLAAQLTQTKDQVKEAFLDQIKRVNFDFFRQIKENLEMMMKDLSKKIHGGINIDTVRGFNTAWL